MSDSSAIRDELPNADQATLRLLSVLEEDDSVSQRELALRIGVALGFANKLIKRAVNKGLLKVNEAPAKRYAYYLTPKGFAEKSRLVGEYLSTSLNFFRRAREENEKIFQQLKEDGRRSIALFGISELAEISILVAHASEFSLNFVVEENSTENFFSGLPVVTSLKTAKDLGIDAVIICRSEDPQNAYFNVRKYFGDDQIYAVSVLHITRKEELSTQEL